MEELSSPPKFSLKPEEFTLDISFALLDVKERFKKYVNS